MQSAVNMATVLVVDSDRAALRAVARPLERLGAFLCCASSSSSARLLLTRGGAVDIVLVGTIPDRPELLRWLATKRPQLQRIVLTGGDPTVTEWLRTGMIHGWLSRPWDVDDLRRILHQRAPTP